MADMTNNKSFSDSFLKYAVIDIIKFAAYLKLSDHLHLVNFKELSMYMSMKNKKYNVLTLEDFERLFKLLDNKSHGHWKIRVVRNKWIHLE
jgi:hypothetical protein